MTTSAIRKDRALTPAHVGAGLLGSSTSTAASTTTGNAARISFAGVPAYVADQESHPPRGSSPA